MIRRIALVAVFLTLFAGVWGGFHYYAWARLARDTGLPGAVSAAIAIVLVCLALLPFASRATALPRPLAAIAHDLGWGWFGVLGLANVTLFATDLARLALSLAVADDGTTGAMAASRLQAAVALGSTLALAGTAFWNTRGAMPVKHVEVALEDWPAALDGYRIVQLSDVHVAPGTSPSRVRELVQAANAQAPDLLAITGDLVDGAPAQLAEAMQPLSELRARDGVFFVTGNHEYFSGGDRWVDFNRGLGMRVLQNERVTIARDGASFELAGVPDWRGADFGDAHRPRLADTLDGRDPAKALVLLAHQPRQFPEAAALGVSLQLSGHTHGGQVWPFTLVVRAVEPFAAGLYVRGRSRLYVSRGTGWWGPALRLGAPMELTVLTLRRAIAKA